MRYLENDCVLEDFAVFVVVEFGVVEYLCHVLDKLVEVDVSSFLQPSLQSGGIDSDILLVYCQERLVL